MIKIKKYAEFNTLHIFDFDDTLVETPSFEKVVLKYLTENITAKELLDKSLNIINIDIKDLKWENGRIYINDENHRIPIKGNWVRKKDRVYLMSPDLFSYIDESMPNNVKQLSKLYNTVIDKCILTARPDSIHDKIVKSLKKLGLDYPKYGIYMRPENRKNAGEWKGEKIVEIAKKYNFKKIIFYDDNAQYIRKAKVIVKKELPNLNFETIKIQ
jgi:hypothetical protein